MGKKDYSSSNKKVVTQQTYDRPQLKGLNKTQNQYINLIKNQSIVVAIGPAGTGKTYIPSVLGVDWVQDPQNRIKRIIIIRPPEGPGKTMGFLPGGLEEKLKVWAAPILSAIEGRLGGGPFAKERVGKLIEQGFIQLLSLEHVRGLSMDNSLVILDEAENCSWNEIKAVLTRLGKDTKLIISGDIKQKDIRGDSGLSTLINLTKSQPVHDDIMGTTFDPLPWSMITFELEDVVRSPLVFQLLKLFDRENL